MAKVAAQAASKPATVGAAFKVRKEAVVAEPTVSTLDGAKSAVKDLDAIVKALLPKAMLGPAITASPAQARQLSELCAIEAQIAALTDGLHAKASAIRSDLTAAIDSAGASEIIATAVGLRYCAEPRGASVSLRSPTVGHTLRTITK